MIFEETYKILKRIGHIWVGFEDKMTEPLETAREWHKTLSKYDFELCNQAIEAYIELGNVAFAPSLPQLVQWMNKTKAIKEDAPSKHELFAMIQKAASNSIYNSGAEFNKLPPILQQWVGTPSALRSFALDYERLNTVIRNAFMKEIDGLIQINMERERSKQIFIELQNKAQNLLEGGDY